MKKHDGFKRPSHAMLTLKNGKKVVLLKKTPAWFYVGRTTELLPSRERRETLEETFPVLELWEMTIFASLIFRRPKSP